MSFNFTHDNLNQVICAPCLCVINMYMLGPICHSGIYNEDFMFFDTGVVQVLDNICDFRFHLSFVCNTRKNLHACVSSPYICRHLALHYHKRCRLLISDSSKTFTPCHHHPPDEGHGLYQELPSTRGSGTTTGSLDKNYRNFAIVRWTVADRERDVPPYKKVKH